MCMLMSLVMSNLMQVATVVGATMEGSVEVGGGQKPWSYNFLGYLPMSFICITQSLSC